MISDLAYICLIVVATAATVGLAGFFESLRGQ
jgi:hypothetical protein